MLAFLLVIPTNGSRAVSAEPAPWLALYLLTSWEYGDHEMYLTL